MSKRTFDARKLASELGLKTLDEREDLPVYGQWPRVKRRIRRDFDEIHIWIHDRAEVATPAFRRFLRSAAAGYLEVIGQWLEDPRQAEPWRANGRQWHLSQKAIPSNRQKHWKPATLVELLGHLNKFEPALQADWNHKTAVVINHPRMDKPWGKIVTSNRYGLRVELRAATGVFTPAKIERLGPDPQVKRNLQDDRILFTFKRMDQVDLHRLRSVLKEAEQSLSAAAHSSE